MMMMMMSATDGPHVYVWVTKSGVVHPVVCRSLDAAQAAAEADYRRLDRGKNPDAAEQQLEWREQTSPRGFGFGNRFWALYAKRRYKAHHTVRGSGMFFAGYHVSEMTMGEDGS